MTILLSPSILRATYKLLVEMEPFKGWNLPDADEIGFRVIKDKGNLGMFKVFARRPYARIQISERTVGHTNTLVATMAHEMIHLFIYMTKQTDTGDHGETFQKYGTLVCGLHGWDPKLFT